VTGSDARPPERTRLWAFRRVVQRYLNPVTRLFAGWMPGFGILTHRGRMTGRPYRIPVNVFRRGDDLVFFLTYGSDVDWVKNVLAAGTCTLRTRGREVTLVGPELITDPKRRLAPLPARVVGRLIGASNFVRMRPAPTPGAFTPGSPGR
jgi:deazaflavin-dependent oxidoreductase (nitroreductase family)